MYRADGIELTKSEYEILRSVSDCGWVANADVVGDARADTYRRSAYARLADLGFLTIARDSAGVVSGVFLNGEGRDWIDSFDASEDERKRTLSRQWKMLVVDALVSGAVSLVVSLIVTHL